MFCTWWVVVRVLPSLINVDQASLINYEWRFFWRVVRKICDILVNAEGEVVDTAVLGSSSGI